MQIRIMCRVALALDLFLLVGAVCLSVYWVHEPSLWAYTTRAEASIRPPEPEWDWSDHHGPEARLVVSVTRDGRYFHAGRERTLEQVRVLLVAGVREFAAELRARGRHGYSVVGDDRYCAALGLLVRADRETRWGVVRRLLTTAGAEGIYMVQFMFPRSRCGPAHLPVFAPEDAEYVPFEIDRDDPIPAVPSRPEPQDGGRLVAAAIHAADDVPFGKVVTALGRLYERAWRCVVFMGENGPVRAVPHGESGADHDDAK